MKPDWRDAPEWANYLAMDEDGTWFWYAYMPARAESTWDAVQGKYDIVEDFNENNWKDTLEVRPE